MKDAVYKKFVKRWESVVSLPPQKLGPLTPYYKMLTGRFKVMPWPWLVVSCGLLVIGFYFLVGTSIVRLVSFLQRGF